ncbi:MAG: DNA gyrase inhibitor YacG [Alphaproteobacteria bacterium]|nr:DNA gyrase inhibitor YacG [Alphaproteobacteria bacterium]
MSPAADESEDPPGDAPPEPVPLPPRRARARAAACPVCGKPLAAAAPTRPFCSRRCADLDLHRWLSGGYRVETEEAPEGEATDPGPSSRSR